MLVAQDLASYGRDLGRRRGHRAARARPSRSRVARTRLLYLYPSELTDGLIEVIGDHRLPLLRPLPPARVAARTCAACAAGATATASWPASTASGGHPDAALRSSFIVGYPGETEDDHDQLLAFLEAAELDWAGFFPFSPEEGTYAAGLPDPVAPALAGRAAGRVRRAAGRHHRPPAPALVGQHAARCWWTSPGWPAATARRPRSTG